MQQRAQKSILSPSNQSVLGSQNSLAAECQQLQIVDAHFDALSHFSGFTLGSNFTLSNPSLQYLAPLKGIFYDFKDMAGNKPTYRNKGEANNVYRAAFVDARKIYHSLTEVLNDLIANPLGRESAQKEKLKTVVGSDKKQDLDDIIGCVDRFDVLQLKKEESISCIDHLKQITTCHK